MTLAGPPALTEPLALAGRTAASRVMFGPHETNLGAGRALSPRHVAYYERRAAGGAGLIVTETASVDDSDWPYERAPLAAACPAGWRAVVEACRPHGALVVAGLGHSGSQGSSAYARSALWAPSRVADVVTREMPMEMESPEIERLVDGFAAAAGAATAADLDGVEVDAGQFSLLRQFLSGLTNLRDDAFGEDRVRLLRTVLDAVRGALGDGRVLGLRLCCDELAPWAGITPERALEVAAGLAGRVDYLVVVRGSAMNTSATRPDLHTEPGFNIGLCRSVRTAVAGATRVVLQGSVVDPGQAEWALDDGVADLVEMTRAQIADPRLVALWRAGEGARVRPCVLCNQKCRVRDSRNPVVSCVAEPRSGHETQDPPVEGTDPVPLDALVVGGGPAGMEAARVLAGRGHRVEVAERAGRLGGMLRTASAVGGRSALAGLADWWEAELLRLGVTVTTGSEITARDLDSARAAGRTVLLATGSVPGPRRYSAAAAKEAAPVVDVTDLLVRGADEVLPAGPVAVLDPVGDAVGAGVAEQLAASGRKTSIVTQDQVVGTQLALTGDLADANARLQRAGVTAVKRAVPRAVGPGELVVEDVMTGRRHGIACAAVVHCGHRLADETLFLARPGTARAGDCVAPRTVHEAVLEGRRAALVLAAEAKRAEWNTS
ncbi:mycofactocin system FadH/OYE family oxidoreductase 1 [Streptomyces sp. NPDC008313]|uniref:mycofactocin system FadH/OYE family oxidoreductase 1 n=1 Tax=Streptomyces sp. NPDC008313 TaxID=3364826 RepID=UPI0036E1D9A6